MEILKKEKFRRITEKGCGKMEIKILELQENYARLIVKGEDHTFLNLLQNEILKDDDVIIAKYNIPHPLVGDPELVVKTKSKNPLEVIKEANIRIIKRIDEVLNQI